MKPLLLDLFCGAGGAAMGYHRAGFEVVGVDHEPQPHYPFEFHQADALEFVSEHSGRYSVIHASPPCQKYTGMRRITRARFGQIRTNPNPPDLIAATRRARSDGHRLDGLGRDHSGHSTCLHGAHRQAVSDIYLQHGGKDPMTDKKVTPIQIARRWAREHPDATGCIGVEYLVPKGRGGRRGMGLRRDHYLVEAGKAAKVTSRNVALPEGGRLRSFNGYCYHCGGIFLKPVLHRCYVPDPRAGQPAKDGYREGLVYADLGMAGLCSNCAEHDGVVGWDDGRIILSGDGKVTTWLGGGTSECTRNPLVVLGLENQE